MVFAQFFQNPNLLLSSTINHQTSSVKNHGKSIRRLTTTVVKYSLDEDLYKYDIISTRAHASMLAKQGLMSSKEKDTIFEGLDVIKKQIENGEFTWRIDREDVHTNIDRSLTDLIGETATKLHIARSRNDQVSTDLRLWCRDAVDEIIARIKDLQVSLMSLAMKSEGVIVPAYAHSQRAQPIILQRHLVECVQQLDLDAERLQDCREGLDFCPLGACALAGTALPIDRFMTSDSLGFTSPMRNSIDAVSDRDYVLEFLSSISITAMYLSEEIRFITVTGSVLTASKITPHEKKPTLLEHVRRKAARVARHVSTLQVLCKGRSLAYNRDLQVDTEPVFDSVETVIGMLQLLSELARNTASKELSCNSVRDTILGVPLEKQLESGESTSTSQNNQVSSEFYLWGVDVIDQIFARVKRLQVSLVNLALENEGVIVRGYPHLQIRAQPILLQHHLLAYVEKLDRDARRLLDCRKRLGENSTRVSKRAFLLELLSVKSIIAIHLSRLGEEWLLWASKEYGFITPRDSVSKGNSIMPQYKDPDLMELVRGKSATFIGDHASVRILYNGLFPRAYHCDLQEEKKHVYDNIKSIIETLEVASDIAQNITFNRERIYKTLPTGHLDATTLADYLVLKGLPFRTSHAIVGNAVALCDHKECQLQNLLLDELRNINLVFDMDVYEYLGVENSIKKFQSYGSSGSECVDAQLAFWNKKVLNF